MTAAARCTATTARGARCRRVPAPGALMCAAHLKTRAGVPDPGVVAAARERAAAEARATLVALGEEPAQSAGAIERYASAVGAFVALEREWERAGRPGLSEGGSTGLVLVPHPLVAELALARREAAHMGGLLGLDPRGRSVMRRRAGGRPQGAASAPDRAAPPPVRTLRGIS